MKRRKVGKQRHRKKAVRPKRTKGTKPVVKAQKAKAASRIRKRRPAITPVVTPPPPESKEMTRPQPPTHRLVLAADITALVVIGGLAFCVVISLDGLPRLVLALLFVTAVPGWALVRGVGIAASATGVTMAPPLSLAICATTSTIMVWLHAWHPIALFGILSVASAALIIWMLRPYSTPQLIPAPRFQT